MNNGKVVRNNNIDLLKFLCMIGVVLVHLTGQGGLVEYPNNNFFSYNIYLLINNILRNSLNVFCIITGYLYISKINIKFKNIINVLSNIVFYSFIIVFIFYFLNLFNIRNLGFMYLINSLFPSRIGRYWFITCYILLFFMIPFINHFINSISKKTFKILLIILFIMFCIIPEFLCYDFFRLNYGYSPFWLIYLYMIGAYIKIYGINLNIKTKCLGLLLSVIINCLIVFFTKNYLSNSNMFYNLGEYFTSPFMVISSVLIFDVICHINIKDNFISKLGKYSLAVYIIHCHRLIYDWVIKNNLINIKPYNIIIELLLLLLIACAIYLICTIIDIIRKLLFKVLKIDILIDCIGNRLDEVLSWK